MWQNIVNAWLDPIRRRNSISRIAETYVPALLVLLIVTRALWVSLIGAAAIVAGEFALYEYVLERYGFAGYYFERGPRDGETFTRP